MSLVISASDSSLGRATVDFASSIEGIFGVVDLVDLTSLGEASVAIQAILFIVGVAISVGAIVVELIGLSFLAVLFVG